MPSMQTVRAFVDAVEEGQVRLLLGEDEAHAVVFPRQFLPGEVCEGSVLRLEIFLDPEAEVPEREEILKLMQDLGDQP